MPSVHSAGECARPASADGDDDDGLAAASARATTGCLAPPGGDGALALVSLEVCARDTIHEVGW